MSGILVLCGGCCLCGIIISDHYWYICSSHDRHGTDTAFSTSFCHFISQPIFSAVLLALPHRRHHSRTVQVVQVGPRRPRPQDSIHITLLHRRRTLVGYIVSNKRKGVTKETETRNTPTDRKKRNAHVNASVPRPDKTRPHKHPAHRRPPCADRWEQWSLEARPHAKHHTPLLSHRTHTQTP